MPPIDIAIAYGVTRLSCFVENAPVVPARDDHCGASLLAHGAAVGACARARRGAGNPRLLRAEEAHAREHAVGRVHAVRALTAAQYRLTRIGRHCWPREESAYRKAVRAYPAPRIGEHPCTPAVCSCSAQGPLAVQTCCHRPFCNPRWYARLAVRPRGRRPPRVLPSRRPHSGELALRRQLAILAWRRSRPRLSVLDRALCGRGLAKPMHPRRTRMPLPASADSLRRRAA
jgi:hypothetical protein